MSLDLLLVTIIIIIGRERRATCTHLINKAKAWTTNIQQYLPVNVTINN
jgi:hypothetical protein